MINKKGKRIVQNSIVEYDCRLYKRSHGFIYPHAFIIGRVCSHIYSYSYNSVHRIHLIFYNRLNLKIA